MLNKHSLLACLITLLALLVPQANASVTGATPSPGSATVPVQGATALRVNWRVSRTESNRAGGPYTVTVSSPDAILYINGVAVATLAGTLSQSSTLGAAQSTTLMMQEVLTLTAAQSRQIAAAPSGSVSIRRVFDDTQAGSATANLPLYAGANTSGLLNVQRIDLKFQNDERTAVVGKGNRQHAIAEVNFRGNGVLKGEWRISEPTSTLGQAQGRRLEIVRRQLVSSGLGSTRIISPALPTQRNGLYLVTFYVEQAEGTIEIPVLRYFVLEDDGERAPAAIETLTPALGSTLGTKTVFSWPPITNAAAYEIGIYSENGSFPITGKMVTGKDLHLSLSSFSLGKLAQGESYEWQLRAFDQHGRLLGVSPRQPIHYP